MSDTFIHDPQADLDYAWSWVAWLAAGETISSFTITPDAGITVGTGGQAASQSGGIVTAWLSGGTIGDVYDVVCHITTSAGRQDDRTIRLIIQNR